MHATFWGFEDHYPLLGPRERYQALTPSTGAREAAEGHDDPVPKALASGRAAMREAAPRAHDDPLALVTDPGSAGRRPRRDTGHAAAR